jgi:hypothetical protein
VDAIQERLVDSEEDNMLKVPSDGREAALDMRLVDPTLFQHGPTKISATADLLSSVYEEQKDRIYTDPKTGEPDPVPGALQLVFCDFGTPSDRWNVYGELKDQLRRRGVPEHMVRSIHEAKNDTEEGRSSPRLAQDKSPSSWIRPSKWASEPTSKSAPCTW